MYIIAGLGNPDRKYAGTRHNMGFDAVTALSDKYGIALAKSGFQAKYGQGFINGRKVILMQPQTYMNLSGNAIGPMVNFYQVDPEEELIVIQDDIDLPVGQIRIRAKGSAGGHNGLKDIIRVLGTQNFTRIKIGVGGKPEGGDLVNHVLGHFTKDDEVLVRKALAQAAEAAVMIMEDGVQAAMNVYNAKPKKEPAEGTDTNDSAKN